jgi:hypothetical protein
MHIDPPFWTVGWRVTAALWFTLEYASEGKVTATGRPYRNRYISVVTIRNRKIVHWRDYLDPLHVYGTNFGHSLLVGEDEVGAEDLEQDVTDRQHGQVRGRCETAPPSGAHIIKPRLRCDDQPVPDIERTLLGGAVDRRYPPSSPDAMMRSCGLMPSGLT